MKIDVVKKPSGYEHRLVEINSKNIVKLNGKPINRGDILVLKFGDVLTLGVSDIDWVMFAVMICSALWCVCHTFFR